MRRAFRVKNIFRSLVTDRNGRIIFRMKLICLMAMLLGLSSTVLAETGDEAAVKAAHDAFLKAARTGDRAALDKLFAPQLQYSHSSAKLENKKEAIDGMAANPVDFTVQSQTIHVYGKTATLRAKASAKSNTGVTPLMVLQVWVQNGKDWQMVERCTTRIPE
jgi:ketosteroid isomerase-like protein